MYHLTKRYRPWPKRTGGLPPDPRERQWENTYWRMKGLYPDEEVWLMSEAEKLDSEEFYAPNYDESDITKWKGPAAEIIERLEEEELVTYVKIFDEITKEYGNYVPFLEKVYDALSYVQYLSFLNWIQAQGPAKLRPQDVSYERLLHDKCSRLFKRMEAIREAKSRGEPIETEGEYEILEPEEGEEDIVKVEYDFEKAPEDAETQSGPGNEGSD